MTHFIVETNGYFLRGTTWAFSDDRAEKFETEMAAMEGLAKAEKFMKASAFRSAKIITVIPE